MNTCFGGGGTPRGRGPEQPRASASTVNISFGGGKDPPGYRGSGCVSVGHTNQLLQKSCKRVGKSPESPGWRGRRGIERSASTPTFRHHAVPAAGARQVQRCRTGAHASGLQANSQRSPVEDPAHEPVRCVAREASVQQAVTCAWTSCGGRDPQSSGLPQQQLVCGNVIAGHDQRRSFLREVGVGQSSSELKPQSWQANTQLECSSQLCFEIVRYLMNTPPSSRQSSNVAMASSSSVTSTRSGGSTSGSKPSGRIG